MKNESYKQKRDSFNFKLILGSTFEGRFDMPKINATQNIPDRIISFNEVLSLPASIAKNYYVHFYIDDYQFERIWNIPTKYITVFQRCAGIIGPDFSMYVDMPKAQQIWNDYRNKALSSFFQKNGINVIPNVCWSDESSFDFCFDGLPKNSVVAVSSNGCLNKLSSLDFINGFREMIKSLTPTTVLCYGEIPKEVEHEVHVILYKNKIQMLKEI